MIRSDSRWRAFVIFVVIGAFVVAGCQSAATSTPATSEGTAHPPSTSEGASSCPGDLVHPQGAGAGAGSAAPPDLTAGTPAHIGHTGRSQGRGSRVRRVKRLGAAALMVVTAGALLASCKTPVVQAACDGKLVSSTPGTIQDPKIVEPSGVVASARNAGTLWVLNDSGDTAKLYAINETGATRVTYTLSGATNVDWEELSIGRGPVADRTYLYAGDIGDNAFNRAQIVVYRVPEPIVSGAAAQTVTGVDKLTFMYPDGAKDSEAFVVDPRTGEMYFFHKSLSGGPAAIYRAPANLAAGSTTVLTKVGSLNLPSGSLQHAITSADISPDGNSIAVRTYGAVRLWTRESDQTFLAALATAPCTGPVPAEVQGEAVGFRPDNRGYYTIGEATSSAIHRYVVAP